MESKDRVTNETDNASICYMVWRPGLSSKYPMSVLKAGIKAFVIEGFHSGTLHACGGVETRKKCEYSAVPFLRRARKKRVPVFLIFGQSVCDPDCEGGYETIEVGPQYVTTEQIIAAGIIPLRANWRQSEEVLEKLNQIMKSEGGYDPIIRQMYASYPFARPLEEITSSQY